MDAMSVLSQHRRFRSWQPVEKLWTLLLRGFLYCGAERGVAMSFMDLDTTSNKVTGQRDLSPKGFANNGPATLLLLSRRPMKGILLRRASSAGHFWQNSNIHSFSTGC
jgi:hypothetical protein